MQDAVYEHFMKEHGASLFELAKRNTKHNKNGDAVISRDDEWCNPEEDCWDKLYEELEKKDAIATRSVDRKVSIR